MVKTAPPAEPGKELALNFKRAVMAGQQQINDVLPKAIDPMRFLRVALMALNNPALAECTPMSALECVMDAAKLGLDFSPVLGEAYPVPFFNKPAGVMEVKLIAGYQGLAKLARQAEAIEIEAECVFEGDVFRVQRGTNPKIDHEPRGDRDDDSQITHAYAVARFPDGRAKFEVMTRGQIEKIRAISKQPNGQLWGHNYHEAARKTVVKRLAKYLPKSPDSKFTSALEREQDLEIIDSTAAEVQETPAGNRAEKLATKLKAMRQPPAEAPVAPPEEPTAAAAAEAPPAGPAAPEPTADGPGIARYLSLINTIANQARIDLDDAERVTLAFLGRYKYEPHHLADDGRWSIISAQALKRDWSKA